jgi:ubiquitin C-terminal hydrolase
LDEYQCDGCAAEKKPRGPAVIQRRIWRLPQNLIVVLKRFNFNGTKCHANFSADSVQKFTEWFAEASPESSRGADYTLQSIVDHHGTANGGHYTAQVKSPMTGAWMMYDDETATRIRDGEKCHLGPMNYVLFYRKA